MVVEYIFTIITRKNKLDNNTKPGIFLSYTSDSLGYKVFDLSTNSIISVRDAYFMENIPGSIETTILSSGSVDSLYDITDSPIDREHSNNNSQLMNNIQSNNNSNTSNNNTNNNNN